MKLLKPSWDRWNPHRLFWYKGEEHGDMLVGFVVELLLLAAFYVWLVSHIVKGAAC